MIRLLVLLTESLILCCRAVADVGVGADVGPPGLHLLQVVLRAGVRAPVIALTASKRAAFGWGVRDSRCWDEVDGVVGRAGAGVGVVGAVRRVRVAAAVTVAVGDDATAGVGTAAARVVSGDEAGAVTAESSAAATLPEAASAPGV